MKIGIIVETIRELDFFGKWDELFKNNNAMERTLQDAFGNIVENIEERGVDYIYFGSSFCEYKIPSILEFERFVKFCDDNMIKKVLVTPIVSDEGINKISDLLNYIIKHDIICDLVVNDFGVLELLKDVNFKGKLWFGRLLEKTIHDTRITTDEKLKYYSESGYEYMKMTSYTSSPYINLLNRDNVEGVHFDYAVEGRVIGNHVKTAVIYPSEYITTGRMCWYRIAMQGDEQKYELGTGCNHPCMRYKTFLWQNVNHIVVNECGERIREIDYIRKGNTLFSLHRAKTYFDFLSEVENKCDRVIYDMSILF